MTSRPWHPINDMPKEADESSKQATNKSQLPKEVVEQFRPERLQHFVTSLYISEREAARIARITNQHLMIEPSKSGFSHHDGWTHRKQRCVIFGYLCKHLQNILNEEDAKWVIDSLKTAKRD